MTVCLIGKSLTTLVLSKIFINKGVNVDIYYSNNKSLDDKSRTTSRTIGLSNYSIDFLENEKIISNITKVSSEISPPKNLFNISGCPLPHSNNSCN